MPKRKLPPNEEVVQMYDSGMSCGEIAEKCDVASVTVDSLLRRIGHKMRSAAEAAKVRSERGRCNTAKYWLGKTQPPEMVEKRINKIRGENHYLWKGGDSRRDYRGKVKKVACEKCGARLNLGIHHKNNDHYDDSPENLAVLCVSCHMSIHKTAYWKAYRNGEPTPKSNGPVGWVREGGEATR